jgi:hypothetical protein
MENASRFLYEGMSQNFDPTIVGEQSIRNYYKFPLGLWVQNDLKFAEQVYNHIISQPTDEVTRDFNIYYDCWLYIYAKIVNNPNATNHYQKIMNNKTLSGGFSALPNQNPELRATAISAICAFFEKDKNTLITATDFICNLHMLNEQQDNFYFMTDKQNCLIKDFSIEQERKYIFKTQRSRPLLYAFSLATIALLSAFKFTQDRKYLENAERYARIIMQNDIHNDYCGKSIVAMGMMYQMTKQQEYLRMVCVLAEYINKTTKTENGYIQNEDALSIDRLAEYAIGLEFCKPEKLTLTSKSDKIFFKENYNGQQN